MARGLTRKYAEKWQRNLKSEIAQPNSLFSWLKVRSKAFKCYFDDRKENAEAGRNFGFQSVLVKTYHLEEHQEWQEINK